VKYLRLYCDQDGVSRFEDLEFTFSRDDFAPPAPLLDVSNQFDASAFVMIRLPAGWTDALHPAPARQFMLIVSGAVEVVAGGERRVLKMGDVLLAEDTSGAGHGTTALEENTAVAVVRLV